MGKTRYYKVYARPKKHYLEVLKKRYTGSIYEAFTSDWRIGSYPERNDAEEAIEAAQYPNKIDFEFVIEEY